MDLLLHIGGILVTAALAALLPPWPRRLLLLAAATVLYGAIDWRFPLLLWAIILVTYAAGLWLGAKQRSAGGILGCVALVLAPLAVYKYLPVWLGGLDRILPVSGLDFGGYGSVLVPVGLSFYSFACCGYLIDVHRRTVPPERHLARLALFASFYPVLLSGPIERYASLSKPLWEGRRPSPDMVMDGLLLIAWGLFLKEVLGDRLGGVVDAAYTQYATAGWRGALTGFLCFALQLLADFGGYSLIAVGAGKLFGLELIRNFRQPYFAETLPDFWQRWHISLTRWIGDYVYRPTGMMMVRLTRWGRWRKEAVAAYVTWITMGLWHGAEATFVVFGAVQASLLLAWKALPNPPATRHPLRRGGTMLVTFAIVVITFGIIRASSLEQYGAMLGALLTLEPGRLNADVSRTAILVSVLMIAVEAIARFRPQAQINSVWLRAALIFLLVLAAVVLGTDDARNFVYFRF